MESIIAFEDFLKTYLFKTQERTKLYLKVMKLRNKYDYGSKKMAKMLDISRHKIEGWIYQKNVPKNIKAIEQLEKLGLKLPLYVSKSKKFILFIKIFSFSFGDGGISKNFRVYLTGNKTDLEDLKKEINFIFGLECRINKIKSENNYIGNRLVKGESFSLDIQGEGSYALGRALCAAGAPIGEKSSSQFLIPKWVEKGPKWVKKLFLEVLLGNEIQTPKLDNYGCHFGHIQFRMSKIKKYSKYNKKLLNQIISLLKEFGIKTSEVKLDKQRSERKDKNISQPMYFQINRNKLNVYNFYKKFELLYAKEKQYAFECAAYAVRKSLHSELLKIHQYEKTKKLRRRGLGCRKIAKILDIPEKRSMVDGWLNSQQPIYLNKKEELKKILK